MAHTMMLWYLSMVMAVVLAEFSRLLFALQHMPSLHTESTGCDKWRETHLTGLLQPTPTTDYRVEGLLFRTCTRSYIERCSMLAPQISRTWTIPERQGYVHDPVCVFSPASWLSSVVDRAYACRSYCHARVCLHCTCAARTLTKVKTVRARARTRAHRYGSQVRARAAINIARAYSNYARDKSSSEFCRPCMPKPFQSSLVVHAHT